MSDEEPRAEGAEEGGPTAPLRDLAERVRSQRSAPEGAGVEPGEDDEGSGLEEFFREETYEEIDPDGLWSSLDAEPDEPTGIETESEPGEHLVSKRAYCESCEHFSEPPAVHCTHPGTTILEFVDTDHVRLRNCPIVAERLTLGQDNEETVTGDLFSGH